ncbi:GH21859 [Drosophila grimshawi]|uniref:glycogenin glucosyltransferase n=1 Tax=Drosophila grimshawi TaxID=7222 RepID=B4J7P0_DROGR|nr:GH21859 [Drosophila grimshawi]
MSKFAWVTLTTNDTYSLGALVLANSLKRAGTAHQLAVMVTPTVSEAMRDRLKEVYNVVQEVNVMDSHDAANLALLARPELGVTFTKLHCWRLVQFEKCVFLDADTLDLIQHWWTIFCDSVHESLSDNMAGLAGALSQLRIGVERTPEQEQYENLMRRQCWESGQVDYSGADAFDNIWKKITKTLEAKPEKPTEADQTGSS